MNEFDALKKEIKKLLSFLEDDEIIEETGQTYHRAHIRAIFDKDKEQLYTILSNLKRMSD